MNLARHSCDQKDLLSVSFASFASLRLMQYSTFTAKTRRALRIREEAFFLTREGFLA